MGDPVFVPLSVAEKEAVFVVVGVAVAVSVVVEDCESGRNVAKNATIELAHSVTYNLPLLSTVTP